MTVSGQLGGFYLFATRFTIYITFMNLLQVMRAHTMLVNISHAWFHTFMNLTRFTIYITFMNLLQGILVVTLGSIIWYLPPATKSLL